MNDRKTNEIHRVPKYQADVFCDSMAKRRLISIKFCTHVGKGRICITAENLLCYISTNFYRTQPTFGDAMTKVQGLVFWNTVCILR